VFLLVVSRETLPMAAIGGLRTWRAVAEIGEIS
jgi:hypothetical protein